VATLLLITGYPAAGKSTLAAGVADRLGWPLLKKDAVKEVLYDQLGVGDRPWSQRLGAAAFEVAWTVAGELLGREISVIVEGPALPAGEPSLRGLVAATGARLVIVTVTAPPDVIMERAERRAHDGSRHPGHLDAELLDMGRDLVSKPYPSASIAGAVSSEVESLADDAVDQVCALVR
jgi:predicted kinase